MMGANRGDQGLLQPRTLRVMLLPFAEQRPDAPGSRCEMLTGGDQRGSPASRQYHLAVFCRPIGFGQAVVKRSMDRLNKARSVEIRAIGGELCFESLLRLDVSDGEALLLG